MSLELNVATVENASQVEGEVTHNQWGAKRVDAVPQATLPNLRVPHDDGIDILQEHRVMERDTIHSLHQGNAKPIPDIPSESLGGVPIPKVCIAPRAFRNLLLSNLMNDSKLPDPITSQSAKPDFDPFERLLKPMLERDTVQCDTWKEEVQNLLIFAGLFSAVVTAFIIESYKRLQPDPNDTIIGLLEHIAEKLDNPSINGTGPSVSSIVSGTNFSPSLSNININICWFTSLVLSLTAALIGIITLQWLREHQRYDNTLKPQQTMAILNARLHSLEEWYVPQIFTGLPLLLQGALVLFLAGMIEFLLLLRLEVAVPVTFFICIPLIFLIATTLLPILQVCILQDPFGLSINNKVPSPCPYKSPQSLIFHRIGVHSEIVFKFSASIIASAYYVCIVQSNYFVRKLKRHPAPPIYHFERPHLRLELRNLYYRNILRDARGAQREWTSTDMAWLSSRAVHALLLQITDRGNNNLIGLGTVHSMMSFPPEVYDCTRCLFQNLVQSRATADYYAFYHCVTALFSQAVDRFRQSYSGYQESPHIADFAFALGQLLCDVYLPKPDQPNPLITAAFIKDSLLDDPPDGSQTTVETLCAAFMASWTQKNHASLEPTIQTIAKDGAALLIMNRLRITPERLFAISSGDVWLPQIFQHSPYLREHPSLGPSVIHLLRVFLEHCSIMRSPRLAFGSALANKTYGGIATYMRVIVIHQPFDSLDDTLAHLMQLCNINPRTDLIQRKPFLMIAACFYLNAISLHYHIPVSVYYRIDPNFLRKSTLLRNIIIEACGIGQGRTSSTNGWSELDQAVDAIYNHHDPSNQLTNNRDTSDQPTHSPDTSTSPTIHPHGHHSNV